MLDDTPGAPDVVLTKRQAGISDSASNQLGVGSIGVGHVGAAGEDSCLGALERFLGRAGLVMDQRLVGGNQEGVGVVTAGIWIREARRNFGMDAGPLDVTGAVRKR